MPSIYDLKPRFQALLRPLTRTLARIGVTANQVTLAAAALSIATGAALMLPAAESRWFLAVPVVLFVRMALNAIDGMLAREHNQKSNLGAYLNELCDVASDAALYLPFAFLPHVDPPWGILAVVLAGMTELAGVIALQVGATRRYDGPMGKSDRAFVFGACALALGCGVPTGPWMNIFLGIVDLLLCVTIANRVRKGLAAGARV